MRLKDKNIIITGSTAGIGKAIASRCVDEGARVLIHGRNQQRGTELVKQLGSAAVFHADDLSDPAAPPRLVDAALSAFGRIDAVVNNAAWIIRGDIQTTDVNMFDRCMAINLRAPLLLIQAALPHLTNAKGAVLNIGSINGYCGEANQLAYSISKGALMTLSRNLADALCTSHVRVTHFNVGWVLTTNEYELKVADGMPRDWPDHIPPAFAPSGHILSPDHIAAAAVYWLSDESRPISGTVLELEQYPIIGRNPPKEDG